MPICHRQCAKRPCERCSIHVGEQRGHSCGDGFQGAPMIHQRSTQQCFFGCFAHDPISIEPHLLFFFMLFAYACMRRLIFVCNGINVKCFFQQECDDSSASKQEKHLFYPMQPYFESGEECNLAPTITQNWVETNFTVE